MSNVDVLRYEKIEDALLYFGQGITLQFVTNFAWKQSSDGKRRFYYSEYEYLGSMKYPDTETEPLVSVKRDLSHCYLCINNKNNGIGIIIRQGILPQLAGILSEAASWVGSEADKSFKKDGRNLRIIKGKNATIMVAKGMALRFEPVVLQKNNDDEMGVRMYMNDSRVFVDLGPEAINEFLVIIQRIDYSTAAAAAFAAFEMSHQDRMATRTVMDAKDVPKKVDLFKKNKRRGSKGFFDTEGNRKEGENND